MNLYYREISMNLRLRMEYFATVLAQVIMVGLSSVIVLYLLRAPLKEFRAMGRKSFIMQVTPDVINKWGKEPVHVKTGFLIHEFLQFDVIRNNFLMNGVISFEFDPAKVKQEDLDKFSFTKGDIVKKSDPVVKKISDNLTFIQYYIRIQFSTLFDYELFPLDDHTLFLNLTNTALEAENIIFDIAPENFSIPKYLFLSGWNIESYKATSGYAEFASLDKITARHPKIIFSVDIIQSNIRQLLLMLLPMLFIFYFCLFTLSFSDFFLNIDAMVMLTTAFMANAIVIQTMSPSVGYFMLIDYLVIFFLVALFIIFTVHFLKLLPKESAYKQYHTALKGTTILTLHVVFVVLFFYLTRVYTLFV